MFTSGPLMPRPHKPRTIGAEAAAARRIAHERTTRGLTYDALSKAMTERGHSLAPTGLWRIEQGTRPVYVEDAITLADIFNMTVNELISVTPNPPRWDNGWHYDPARGATKTTNHTPAPKTTAPPPAPKPTGNTPDDNNPTTNHPNPPAGVNTPPAQWPED